MKVYARDKDGNPLLLGDCFDRVPKLAPGESWSVEVGLLQPGPVTYTPGSAVEAKDCFYIRHTYRAGLVEDGRGGREVAILISPDSPDPQHLPGWRPNRDTYHLHQTGRRHR